MKRIISFSLLTVCSAWLTAGCSTMHTTPLTTGSAVSYPEHAEQDGLSVGIRAMTDRREVEDMFTHISQINFTSRS
jgi:hypothetical protein